MANQFGPLYFKSLDSPFVCLLMLSFWISPCFSKDPSLSAPLSADLIPDLKDDLQFLAEETVVTSSYEEQPISEAPSNIYMLRAEDIEQSGATDAVTGLGTSKRN